MSKDHVKQKIYNLINDYEENEDVTTGEVLKNIRSELKYVTIGDDKILGVLYNIKVASLRTIRKNENLGELLERYKMKYEESVVKEVVKDEVSVEKEVVKIEEDGCVVS